MARIRSVHPSLFSDEGWVSCSPLARILYIGLWTDADDQGVFEWRPVQIRMRILPADNVDVGNLLTELVQAGLIRQYTAQDKPYGSIKDFQKYQRPRKPNAVHPVPKSERAYLLGEPIQGDFMDLTGSELAPLEAAPVPQKSGIAPQMEDGTGGWRMELEDGIVVPGKARRKPETPIPEGFPDREAITKAEQRISEAAVTLDAGRQAVRFRDHAETHDRRCRDWPAAFRQWITKALEDAPPANVVDLRPAMSPAESAAIALRRHRFWMEDWKKGAAWDRSIRGPRPDEIGCTIPEPIMAEFGYTPVRRAEG